MPKKVKEQSDKHMKKWHRLQHKKKQQKQREEQLANWFYRLCRRFYIGGADDGRDKH